MHISEYVVVSYIANFHKELSSDNPTKETKFGKVALRIDQASRVIFPAVFVAFLAWYFVKFADDGKDHTNEFELVESY